MIVENLRYIVFLIDSQFKEHDGKIFSDILEAKDFISVCVKENYCDKAVIGLFCMNECKEMYISSVETIGFKGDKKDINQLELFV